ncbi:MAG: hypothetical protein NVV59_17655 [Chitinophagaceae bacterium]|nr:hypothetical protein [Chitinophagaceae bacterium]
MRMFSGQYTCLLHVPSEYSDLCLMTCADETEVLQKLVSALTVKAFLQAECQLKTSPAISFLKIYQTKSKVEIRHRRQINAEYLRKAQSLIKNIHTPEQEQQLLRDWYQKLWLGARREVEIELSPSTQLLFDLEKIDLEKFLQYFLRVLSIKGLIDSSNVEVNLAIHCFMSAEL